MLKDKILLFIPCYNCDKQIVRVLNQIDSQILMYITQVIIVNNRSTDETEKKVIEWMGENKSIPIKLLRNDDNYGLGGSHKVAFDYAMNNGFNYVIVLHGDDQGNIHDVLPLLRKGIYKKYDCCLGARFMKGSKLKGYSKFRTFGNRVYDVLFSLVCRFRIKDLGSGLNIYKVKMLEDKFYFKFPDNLMFNYCMVMAIQYYKQRPLFFPISWREDDQVSNVKLFSQAKKVLGMLCSYSINGHKFMHKDLRMQPHTTNYAAKTIFENLG